MHVVYSQSMTQSKREEGISSFIKLLEIIRAEQSRFMNSKRRTMRDIKIPPDIMYILVEGKLYQLRDRRILWFERTTAGYNFNHFYVSEVLDETGHPCQLSLDRTNGDTHDKVRILKVRELGIQAKIGRTYASTGPRVLD